MVGWSEWMRLAVGCTMYCKLALVGLRKNNYSLWWEAALSTTCLGPLRVRYSDLAVGEDEGIKAKGAGVVDPGEIYKKLEVQTSAPSP